MQSLRICSTNHLLRQTSIVISTVGGLWGEQHPLSQNAQHFAQVFQRKNYLTPLDIYHGYFSGNCSRLLITYRV